MISNNTILLLTSILWFMPMLVYHNSNLKYFFAVLGCTGLVVFIAQILVKADPVILVVLGQYLAFVSLQDRKILIKSWKSNVALFIASLSIYLFSPEPIFTFPVLCFAVMWKLQKITVIDYLKNDKIDIFYIALVTYQVILVLYSVLFIVGHKYTSLLNNIFAISQILIIISLSLLKRSTKPMIAKLSLSP